MAGIRFKLVFISILLLFCNVYAQQPFLKFKPNITNVDSFDIILGIAPFKLLNSKLNLNAEMRLFKNLTLNITPSYKHRNNPSTFRATNLEISDPSLLTSMDEQSCGFIIKRYKSNKNSRVYFGPYVGAGFYVKRINLEMTTKIFGFDDEVFNFRSTSKSFIFAIGSSKLVGKKTIFDFNLTLRNQFQDNRIGNFKISRRGYINGWYGSLGFSISRPIIKN